MFKQLADMSPEMSSMIYAAGGFLLKAVIEWLINAFKATISTPVRVTKLEEDFKREMDIVKGWKADHERDINKNWEKYQTLEASVNRLEGANDAHPR